MSPRSDTKYFHIAREGLKTPLPTPWKPAELKNGELVYYNPATKVLQEDHPLDEYFRYRMQIILKVVNILRRRRKMHNHRSHPKQAKN